MEWRISERRDGYCAEYGEYVKPGVEAGYAPGFFMPGFIVSEFAMFDTEKEAKAFIKRKQSGRYKKFRIRGSSEIIEATCIKKALLTLVDEDGDFTYTPHWYTRSNRKSWAEFETSYGYKGVLEEV